MLTAAASSGPTPIAPHPICLQICRHRSSLPEEIPMPSAFAKTLLACAAALALAACGSQDDPEPTYTAGVEDQSGGELIVSTPDPNAVPVRLPETPMTPVPARTDGPSPAMTSPVATPTPTASPAPAD